MANIKKKINMKLVPYHKAYNRNVGRIKSINENNLLVSINAGHGGGDIEIKSSSCYNFIPQVDDRVLLCVDDDGEIEDYVLVKLRKRLVSKKVGVEKNKNDGNLIK